AAAPHEPGTRRPRPFFRLATSEAVMLVFPQIRGDRRWEMRNGMGAAVPKSLGVNRGGDVLVPTGFKLSWQDAGTSRRRVVPVPAFGLHELACARAYRRSALLATSGCHLATMAGRRTFRASERGRGPLDRNDRAAASARHLAFQASDDLSHLGVDFHAILDRAASMQDRAMIAATEGFTDGIQ